jgi:hypothetical protein
MAVKKSQLSPTGSSHFPAVEHVSSEAPQPEIVVKEPPTVVIAPVVVRVEPVVETIAAPIVVHSTPTTAQPAGGEAPVTTKKSFLDVCNPV